MDSDQFKKWWANHLKRYNAIEAWYMAKPERGTGEIAGRVDILQAWFSVLSDVRIDDGIWATEGMFRGDLAQPQGPGFDDHPRAVRRYAMSRAQERAASGRKSVNGERAYECGACRDRGWREIWIPQFLAWARDAFADGPPHDADGKPLTWALWTLDPRAKERPRFPANAVVACNCQAGRRKIERGAMMFDETRQVEYDPRGLESALEASTAREF